MENYNNNNQDSIEILKSKEYKKYRFYTDDVQDIEEIGFALDTMIYYINEVQDLINDYKDKLKDPKFNGKEYIISVIKNFYKYTLNILLEKADLEKRYWELTPYERDTLYEPEQYVID